MNIFLTVLVQVVAGIIAFNIWGFDINSIPTIKFIAGWVILIVSVTVAAKRF